MSLFGLKEWKSGTRENYLLKLEFYNANRKIKRIIRCIFISIIMHPNLMHFHQKINFKSVLEIFTPVSGHLRTALMYKVGVIWLTFFWLWDSDTYWSQCFNWSIINMGHRDRHFLWTEASSTNENMYKTFIMKQTRIPQGTNGVP